MLQVAEKSVEQIKKELIKEFYNLVESIIMENKLKYTVYHLKEMSYWLYKELEIDLLLTYEEVQKEVAKREIDAYQSEDGMPDLEKGYGMFVVRSKKSSDEGVCIALMKAELISMADESKSVDYEGVIFRENIAIDPCGLLEDVNTVALENEDKNPLKKFLSDIEQDLRLTKRQEMVDLVVKIDEVVMKLL